MTDPLGLIGNSGAAGRPDLNANRGVNAGRAPEGGPTFKDALLKNLQQVNDAQRDADKAVEDLVSGRRSDVEGVILATQKADNAFRMLQAVRGKVMAAYDEIRQTSV